jgi:hypothetical protein
LSVFTCPIFQKSKQEKRGKERKGKEKKRKERKERKTRKEKKRKERKGSKLTRHIAGTAWILVLKPRPTHSGILVINDQLGIANSLWNPDAMINTRVSRSNHNNLYGSLILNWRVVDAKVSSCGLVVIISFLNRRVVAFGVSERAVEDTVEIVLASTTIWVKPLGKIGYRRHALVCVRVQRKARCKSQANLEERKREREKESKQRPQQLKIET